MICYSGGAIGSDSIFESVCLENEISIIAFSFSDHNTKSLNCVMLKKHNLLDGFEHVKKANIKLNRNLSKISCYVKNLLSRDWFQVKFSESIYAIGILDTESTVKGGTGYACQMAIDENKNVYLFDQTVNSWHYFDYITEKFEIYNGIPKLTEKFAGIGTRSINNNGINAIQQLLHYNKNV